MKKWVLFSILIVLLAVPIVFWTQVLSGGALWAILYDLGRLLSLSGFVLIWVQYVLSARLKWLEKGIGQDKFFIVHRLSGIVGFVLILIHPALLFASDLLLGVPPKLTPIKLIGFVGVVALLLTAGGALLYKALKWKYETWKALHWAGYAILPIGLVHSMLGGSTVQSQPVMGGLWIALTILYVGILAHRLYVWVRVRQSPYRVGRVKRETHDTWSLTFEGTRLDHQPGQFMRVQLTLKGKLQSSHPFTIASSPTQKQMTITVKAVGDFTRQIKEVKPGSRAYIDAPYGAFSFVNHDAENLVFIAGGIGITPFMSMLRYMRDRQLERKVTLIWGNKAEQDILFKEELDEMSKKMTLKVVHVMSAQENWPGEKGFVDEARLRRLLAGIEDPQVFVCGPPVMMRMVVAALRKLGVPGRRIHSERFSLR